MEQIAESMAKRAKARDEEAAERKDRQESLGLLVKLIENRARIEEEDNTMRNSQRKMKFLQQKIVIVDAAISNTSDRAFIEILQEKKKQIFLELTQIL